MDKGVTILPYIRGAFGARDGRLAGRPAHGRPQKDFRQVGFMGETRKPSGKTWVKEHADGMGVADKPLALKISPGLVCHWSWFSTTKARNSFSQYV